MTARVLRLRNSWIEIIPVWIVLFDELDLPGSIPFLETFFAENRLFDAVILFEVHQPMNPILLGETLDEIHSMFIDSSHQIVCNANVQCAADSAGQNVNPITSFITHQYFTRFAASSIVTDDAIKSSTVHP